MTEAAPPPSARVRTPTVLQMEMVECGAAALAMVLGHHGRRVPLEELRVACDVTRDGTKASNLVLAARRYGLKAKGFRKTTAALREMAFPVILHWNFQHFVVLEGFGQDRAYINDPAYGHYAATLDELEESFTGVALAFETGPEFRARDERPSLVATLRERLRGSEGALAYVLLASLGLVVPGIVLPMLARVIVDRVLVGAERGWAPGLALGLAGVALAAAALTWLQQRHLLRLQRRLAVEGARRFFRHVLALPMEFFAQRYAGDIGGRVELNERVGRLLSEEAASALLNAVTAAFYLALMLAYDVGLALVTLSFALANVGALLLASRSRRERSRRVLQMQAKTLAAATAGVASIETLKASAGELEFFGTWSGHLARSLNAEQEFELANRRLDVVPALLAALSGAAVLGLGAERVMAGAMTPGTLVAFQLLASSFLVPAARLVDAGALLQEAEGHLARLEDVMRYPVEGGGRRKGEGGKSDSVYTPSSSLLPPSPSLQLRDVTFGYARLAPPLVDGLSLDVAPGRWVAIVGRSGSGKSTVARLVAGLYEPWSGEVRIGGVPRREIPRAALARTLAMVDQDVLLFADTVRANLTLWDDGVPDEALVRAARDARIHDDVAGRAGGYGAELLEGGANLSGGQRQRLELARALAQDPAILVLDEATSALDAATEQEVLERLRARGITCLVVAHRLSAVRDCDEILVMHEGKVVERGTHEALVALGGHYVDLIRAA